MQAGRTLENEYGGFTFYEERFTKWVSSRPVVAVVVFMLVFVFLAVAMTTIGIAIGGTNTRTSILIAVTIPTLLSPPTFGYIARLLIMLERQNKEKEKEATTDSLTSISNRRGFFKDSERVRPHISEPCLAMVDVDDFKLINDDFGHDAGDLALVAVASWLQEQTTEFAACGRIGGDEFVYFGSDAELLHMDSHTLDLGEFEVSISIGTTSVASIQSITNAVALADRALYELKKSRGDNVRNIRSVRLEHRAS